MRFTNILDRITAMLASLTKEMPRFDKYMELYTSSIGLQRSMRDIYSAYADFCIQTIKFFRHKPLCASP
jgi:hypothetical protein